MRLDKYLILNALFESRNRAAEAIKQGYVSVNGKVVTKPSFEVGNDDAVTVQEAKFYVSRAARKLESFLQAHPVAMQGKRALDIGSSTGGFAQILLESGVASLTCVDVGRDQLHDSLRDDARIRLFEQTDIRDFDDAEGFALVTCDVSFISILQILPDIERLARDGADIVILFKPQFEVGKTAKRDGKGVVRDARAIELARDRFEAETLRLGWHLQTAQPSQVAGKEGNVEYLYHFVRPCRITMSNEK